MSLQFHSWQQLWHRAAVLLYVPGISQWTLCLGLGKRYETHLIKSFNLSSPSGRAEVADAIIAVLSVVCGETVCLSDNMQSADRCAYR